MFKGVKSYRIHAASTYLVDDNYIYLGENDQLIRKNIITDVVDGRLSLNKKIYKIINNKNTIIVFFENTGQIISKDNFNIIPDKEFENLSLKQTTPYNNKIFVLIGEDVLDSHFGVYDIEKKKILWVGKDVLDPTIISGYFFSHASSLLKYHDLQTSNTFWSLAVSEYGKFYFLPDKKWRNGELKNLLGVYNTILWVLLTNATIIGVELETGKIIHQIKEPSSTPPKFGKLEDKGYNFWYNYNNFLDERQGKIMSLLYSGYAGKQFNCYYEIDLSTNQPQLIISEVENTASIPFKIDGNPCPIWPFDEEFVYLCNYRERKLALFERSSKKIIWVHEMEFQPNASFIIKMEVQGNRWYVLDNSKTLYVYERL
jgi:hypothetical protein